jgi:hypothetical protein
MRKWGQAAFTGKGSSFQRRAADEKKMTIPGSPPHGSLERRRPSCLVIRAAVGFLALILFAGVSRAELIDRVMGVVNGEIITLSDIRGALRFELIPADASQDPLDAALQRLIDRTLLVGEVERYLPPEPPAETIEKAAAAVRSKFKDALEFETVLTRYGFSQEELYRFLRDSLRIDAYLDQRLSSVPPASEADLLRYYRDHQAEFGQAGVTRPFEEVRGEVVARIASTARETFITELLAGLRRRADIQQLYVPGSASPAR